MSFFYISISRFSPGVASPAPLGVYPKVLVFGDSLTKYLEEDCSDVGGCDVALYCERGGTVSSIRENIASIENHLIGLTPDLIFLHVGTNDLQNILVDTIINQYRALLRSIRQIFPTTPVLVNNIFKRGDCESINTAGQYLNLKLGNLIATLPNTTFC